MADNELNEFSFKQENNMASVDSFQRKDEALLDFTYQGVTSKQKKIKGKASARTQKELYEQLKEQGVYAFDIKEIESKKIIFYRLKPKELTEFSRQIATMQAAGISIIKAIGIMKDKATNKKLLQLYNHIYYMINQGNTLSQAMSSSGDSFPLLMINMYRSGEISGRLDDAALKMAKYYESENKMNTKIRNAMAYPTILFVVIVAVVLILFTYVLPVFFEMYESSGTQLNILTRILQGASIFITTNWVFLIIGFIIFLGVMMSVVQLPKVSLKIDEKKLSLPTVGPLLSIIYTARFARTMSSLYSSGIPMIEAVEMSAKTIGNKYLEGQFEDVSQAVRSGQPLSYSIGNVKGIEPKLNASIFIGEESGRLDEMLLSTASEYEFESEMAIERILTYIEPLMIVLMACIIGPILIAALLPMFNMYSLV